MAFNTHSSPLHLPASYLPSPSSSLRLSWVICCVNTVYLQPTGPFQQPELETQLQAANVSSVITGGRTARSPPLLLRSQRVEGGKAELGVGGGGGGVGELLIGISYEEGITNEAI